MGMCFGVREAIAMALEASRHEPVTVLGDLVHNETVLAGLRSRGVKIAQNSEAIATPTVMITAHGASDSAIEKVQAKGFRVMEATCPLVRVAHRAVEKLAREGFYPIIIGKRGHVEVRGLAEDLRDCEILQTEAEVFELKERPRFGVVAQTTQPLERVRYLVGLIRWRFPGSELRFIDTVCQPTKQRQHSAVEVAQEADVVIVIGGAHSNNTHELVKTCARYCDRVFHVQTAADLQPGWFQGAEVIGITAGTSTPDSSIDAVEEWLKDFDQKRTPAPEPHATLTSLHTY